MQVSHLNHERRAQSREQKSWEEKPNVFEKRQENDCIAQEFDFARVKLSRKKEVLLILLILNEIHCLKVIFNSKL